MAIDPTTTITVKVSELASAAFNSSNLVPHEVGGFLKKGTLYDLAQYVKSIIDAEGAIGFRAVQVTDGETLPATDEQEFILVGPGTFPNVGGGATITTTGSLNALVSNGTFWFIGVEIPIEVNGTWGEIDGVISDQDDLWEILEAKADLVDGKVPASQLPSYVDDIVEVANFAALPATGETGKIYLTLDNNKIYRWSGSVYIEIAENQAVWGSITGTLSNQTDLQSALNLRVPTSRTITINGSTQDLSANRTFNIDVGVTSFNTRTGAVTLSSSDVTTALGYTPVTQARTLTINGTTFDLSANRSWTIPAASWGTITGTLSNQTDLQSALDDRPTGNGTINYITKFTGTRSVGLSQIYDDGTNVGIGTTSPAVKLDINGNVNIGNISNTTNNFFRIQTNKAVFSIQANGSTNAAGTTINYTWHDGGQGPLIFNRALGVETMRLDANGNVGIGTTAFNLSASGRQMLSLSGSSSTLIEMQTGGTNQAYIFTGNAGNLEIYGYQKIDFATNGGTRMTITPSGNIGIGTTNPAARLDVNGNIKATSLNLTGSYNASVSTNSSWSSFQTLIPTGTLLGYTTYLISVWFTNNGTGQPYEVACSFMHTTVVTNGTGVENEYVPIISSHTGGVGALMTFRTRSAAASTSGLEVKFTNFSAINGTVFVRATLMQGF
jgi:hypothetical protein